MKTTNNQDQPIGFTRPLKSIRFLTMAVCLLFTSLCFGQNVISQRITEAKNQRMGFPEKAIFKPVQQKYSRTNVFSDLNEVNLLDYDLKVSELKDASLSLTVPIGRKTVTLDLLEVEERFYEYEVTTDKGDRTLANKNTARHYRGIVRNVPNSLVALSFFEGDVMGFISTEEGNYTISKLTDSSQFIIYNDKNLIEQPEFICETTDDDFKGYAPELLMKDQGITSRSFDANCVRLYFETEYDIFQNLGSTAAVQNYVTGLYNQVATIYQNEGISTTISQINIWTTPDPYTGFSTGSVLSQFQNNITTFNGDLGQLLTFRNIGGGRAAGFDGICNPNPDSSLCVSGNLSSAIVNFPNYSWNVMVVTHEFGHLFGSRHTHACVWNGNNTAIDGCGSCQESPNPSSPGCSWCVRPPVPASGGTIMSYCHITPAGINFSLGFGQQPGNVIRSEVANGSCLGTCSLCPPFAGTFDIYSKDRPFDSGQEPNPDTGPMWISEDIWIRQDLDGGTVHQNPEFKLETPNGVYVKVRNRSSTVTSACAQLSVYFSKASTGLAWPAHFNNYYMNIGGTDVLHGDIIGTTTLPAIPPGGSVTVEIPWYPPNPADFVNDIHHFCLVSRIITPNDPMFNEVSGAISPNVRNNNNIVWKNISVYDSDPNGLPTSTSVFIRGVDENTDTNSIMFVDDGFGDNSRYRFFDVGEIEVEMEPELFKRLLESGFQETKYVRIINENTLLVTSNRATIPRVPLRYEETFSLNFKFHIFKELPVGTKLLLDVLQVNDRKGYFEGGERFTIIRKHTQNVFEPSQPIQKLASFNIIPNPNDGIFKLQINNISKGQYRVFDIHGRLIEEGSFENVDEIDINLSGLEEKLYFVKINSGTLNLSKVLLKN
ncbi:M12 family metallo-peptidase [Ascidiimonas aurantiaca]|uniref:M12 family metallo-peptidase n=1 Tax=Ascidiimonas aurantiaca TaxID=1685432 RepID=UPI0030EB3239